MRVAARSIRRSVLRRSRLRHCGDRRLIADDHRQYRGAASRYTYRCRQQTRNRAPHQAYFNADQAVDVTLWCDILIAQRAFAAVVSVTSIPSTSTAAPSLCNRRAMSIVWLERRDCNLHVVASAAWSAHRRAHLMCHFYLLPENDDVARGTRVVHWSQTAVPELRLKMDGTIAACMGHGQTID